jgi:hypothetical protein
MLALLSIILLIFTLGILFALKVWAPGFRFHWLIAVLITLISWILLLSAYFQIPFEFLLLQWQPAEIFPTSLKFLLDEISWAYALSIITMLLAFMLTSIVIENSTKDSTNSASPTGWLVWASACTFVGMGLITIIAGNLITLLLSWMALDIFEIIFRIANAPPGSENSRITLLFSGRVASIIPIAWAWGIAAAEGLPTEYSLLAPQLSILLSLAAILRFGLIPIHLPPMVIEFEQPRLETLLRFVPAGSALVLITRVAKTGFDSEPALYISTGLLFLGLVGSIFWISSRTKSQKMPYYLLTLVAFVLYSAINSNVIATMTWGIIMILSAGLLFLYTKRDQRLQPLIAIGLFSISTLPLSAGWYGVGVYSGGISWVSYAYIIPHAILLDGYLLSMQQTGSPISGAQRLVWIVYPLGLVLLLLTQYIIAFLIFYSSTELGSNLPRLVDSWPALAASALAGGLIFIRHRGLWINLERINQFDTELFISPISRVFRVVFTGGRYATNLLDQLLEGRGGILWTILFLTLIVSILSGLGN